MAKTLYYGQPINWANPLNRGLAGCWGALPNASSGLVLRDITGNGNHGTFDSMDATAWVPGRIQGGKSITTDGSSDRVICPVPSGIEGASTATYSCWCFRTPGTNLSFGFGTGSAARFNVIWYLDNVIYSAFNGTFTAYASSVSGWHHVCTVFDHLASSRMRLYLNGVHVETVSPGESILSTSLDNFYLGYDPGNNLYCVGKHEGARAYSRALSDAEVLALYQDQLRGSPGTLNWLSTRAYGFDTGAAPAATYHNLMLLGVGG